MHLSNLQIQMVYLVIEKEHILNELLNFRPVLFLQNYCEDVAEIPCIPHTFHTQFPPLLTSYTNVIYLSQFMNQS